TATASPSARETCACCGHRGSMRVLSITALIVLSLIHHCPAADAPTREQVVAEMRPYVGPGGEGVDRTTLDGKVMCGYQGWYCAEGDDSGRGWAHYQRRGRFAPGSCTIDLWPD